MSPVEDKGTLMTREEQIRRLEEQIADLKARLPAHSVKPAMLLELEELEEALERLKGERT